MKLAGFLDNSTVNGEGMRSVIFMSGCKHNCPGCHNVPMQDFNYGEEVEVEDIVQRVIKNKDIIDGVTISGGDPFFNEFDLFELLTRLKQEKINVWVYTGFKYEELEVEYRGLLQLIDVLVDGKYIQKLHTDDIKYIGSKNQRIIKLKRGVPVQEKVEDDEQ